MVFNYKHFLLLKKHVYFKSIQTNYSSHLNLPVQRHLSLSLSPKENLEKFSLSGILSLLKRKKNEEQGTGRHISNPETHFEEERNLSVAKKNYVPDITLSKHLQAVQLQARGNGIKFHVALKKSELSSETGLSLRDLRVIDSSFQNQLSMILVRQKAIVINLAHVKAIILSEKIFIFNPYAKRIKFNLIPDLYNKLQEQKNIYRSRIDSFSKEKNYETKKYGNGNGDSANSWDTNPKLLQHHQSGKRNSLKSDGDSLNHSTNLKSDNSSNNRNCDSDDIISNAEKKGSMNFESNQQSKSEINENVFYFSKENQNENEEEDYFWEEINQEIWEKNIKNSAPNETFYRTNSGNLSYIQKCKFQKNLDFPTKKIIVDDLKNEGKGEEKYIEINHEKPEFENEKCVRRNEYEDDVHENADFIFEIKMLEIVLEEVDKSVRMNFASMVPEILRVLKMYVSEEEGVLVEDQRKFLQAKNKLLRFEMGVAQLINALKELLENDEDMDEMYLTRKKFQKNQAVISDHTEVEELIENYYRRLEEVANEIDTLKSTLDATSEYLRTVLDSSRNKLMRIDVVLNMATCSLATGGSVAAIFGMNLFSSWESHPLAFYVVSGGITFSSTLAFVSLYLYAKAKRIL